MNTAVELLLAPDHLFLLAFEVRLGLYTFPHSIEWATIVASCAGSLPAATHVRITR